MKLVHPRTGGFTLVEIMIVVAIIGLLAAVAIPNFVRARETSREKACINNLRQIDGAKDQWALEQGKNDGDACVLADIEPFLKEEPLCPVGLTSYTIGNIGGGLALCASAAAADHNAAY